MKVRFIFVLLFIAGFMPCISANKLEPMIIWGTVDIKVGIYPIHNRYISVVGNKITSAKKNLPRNRLSDFLMKNLLY